MPVSLIENPRKISVHDLVIRTPENQSRFDPLKDINPLDLERFVDWINNSVSDHKDRLEISYSLKVLNPNLFNQKVKVNSFKKTNLYRLNSSKDRYYQAATSGRPAGFEYDKLKDYFEMMNCIYPGYEKIRKVGEEIESLPLSLWPTYILSESRDISLLTVSILRDLKLIFGKNPIFPDEQKEQKLWEQAVNKIGPTPFPQVDIIEAEKFLRMMEMLRIGFPEKYKTIPFKYSDWVTLKSWVDIASSEFQITEFGQIARLAAIVGARDIKIKDKTVVLINSKVSDEKANPIPERRKY